MFTTRTSPQMMLKSLIGAIAVAAAIGFAAVTPGASHLSADASSPAVICSQDTHWSTEFQACVAN
jgi:hypothetical protein